MLLSDKPLVGICILIVVVKIYFFSRKMLNVFIAFVEQYHKLCNASANWIICNFAIPIAISPSKQSLVVCQIISMFC